MSREDLTLDPEAKKALAASASAFARAQKKGRVWLGQSGMFETYEMLDTFVPITPKNIHPEQLRLA